MPLIIAKFINEELDHCNKYICPNPTLKQYTLSLLKKVIVLYLVKYKVILGIKEYLCFGGQWDNGMWQGETSDCMLPYNKISPKKH